MFWMVVFTTAMVIIYALECYFLLRENLILWSRESRPGRGVYRFLTGGKAAYSQADRDSDQARVRLLSLISLPMGLLFYAVNGAIFAVLQDRPLWNTMTPLIFILTALLSGGALITLLAYLFQPEEESIRTLGRVILLILAIFLSLEFMQFVVGYWSEAKITRASLNLILAGPYWWVFWVVHLGLGSALPLYLLISRGDEPRAVAWACFLIIFTFIAVRLNFLIPDQAIYKLEGLDTAFFHRRLQTTYAPNLTEWLVGIWVISLGLLAFLFGTRWLPVITAGKGEEEHV
jgi:molybdopterin-containing oxidoreductase family membrane subunit